MNYRGSKISYSTACNGFALPTVLIASIVMIVVLLSSVSATVAVRTSMTDQYYNQLAKNAAEAGIAYAKACIDKNEIGWGELRPDVECSGAVIESEKKYIDTQTNYQTTFIVKLIDEGATIGLVSTGEVQLLRGPDDIWRKYEQSVHLDPQIKIAASLYEVRVLVVGGGGAGNYDIGGGGGGGGVKYVENVYFKPGSTYTVTVGDGGIQETQDEVANNGGKSSISLDSVEKVSANGGGGAGLYCDTSDGLFSNGDAVGGGGGGGGGGSFSVGVCSSAGGVADGITSFNGGGGIAGSFSAGGGGGAGSAGEDSFISGAGGNGGNGRQFNISGESEYYGGGGGGGGYSMAGLGGNGGGGDGAKRDSNVNASDGTAGLGGGGGGHGFDSSCGGVSGNPCFGGSGGSGVVIISYKTSAMTGFGGTVTYTDLNNQNPVSDTPYSNGYTIHTFTVNGNFTVIHEVIPPVDLLVVAGGGGGGADRAGAGGAGGLIYKQNYMINSLFTEIKVGSGGLGVPRLTPSNSGGNSSFGQFDAIGGGGGGSSYGQIAGSNGGSGGGAGNAPPLDSVYLSGTGAAEQGNNGGSGIYATPNYGAGGGGGAGGVGSNGTANSSGNGGLGKTISITGTPICYAGGGGAGSYSGGTNGFGAGVANNTCGAGDGTANPNPFKNNAIDNTGSGGGSVGNYNATLTGGNGGSGIVIVSIPNGVEDFFEVVSNGIQDTDYKIDTTSVSGKTIYSFLNPDKNYSLNVKTN